MKILKPDDWHCHFRDGDVMKTVVPLFNLYNRCLVMPNVPQILNGLAAYQYLNNIKEAGATFEPVMTIMLQDHMDKSVITGTYECVRACKLYPKGTTTGSEHGVSDVKGLAEIFEIMQRRGIVLCIHAEDPSWSVLNREKRYLDRIDWIVKNFPGLKVVIEHISTQEAIEYVNNASVNVAATITAHHMILTIDDILSNGIHPHNFCYPIAKTEADRNSLIDAALYRNNGKFFFGSDSAPHLKNRKENAQGCAGIFMPDIIAMNVLVKLFQGSSWTNWIDPLENFMSKFGAKFYGFPITNQTIELIEESWIVPEEYDGIVPFKAGQTFNLNVK